MVSGWTVTKRVGGFWVDGRPGRSDITKRIQGDKELNQILRVIRYYREETLTKLHGSFLSRAPDPRLCPSGGRAEGGLPEVGLRRVCIRTHHFSCSSRCG